MLQYYYSASCQDLTMAVATRVIIGLATAYIILYPMQRASPLPRNVCTIVNVPLANLWPLHPQIIVLVLYYYVTVPDVGAPIMNKIIGE